MGYLSIEGTTSESVNKVLNDVMQETENLEYNEYKFDQI